MERITKWATPVLLIGMIVAFVFAMFPSKADPATVPNVRQQAVRSAFPEGSIHSPGTYAIQPIAPGVFVRLNTMDGTTVACAVLQDPEDGRPTTVCVPPRSRSDVPAQP